MNRSEQEQLRHEEYINKLNLATTISELPKKINPSDILSTLTSLASFKDVKIYKARLQKFVEYLMSDISYLISDNFKIDLKNTLMEEYPTKSEEEINYKIQEITSSRRLFNLVSESITYAGKYSELLYNEKNEEHKRIMNKISTTRMIDELPKVGIGEINREIQKELYEIFNKERLKVEFTGEISKCLLDGKTFEDIEIKNALRRICEAKPMIDYYDSMSIEEKVDYLANFLSNDYDLSNLVDEVKAREQRIITIYKLDHNDIMDDIKYATRISQMPPNLSISRITGYLSSNSMIYPKGLNIPSGEFITIAEKLMYGLTFDDLEIKMDLQEIVNKYYTDNQKEALALLFNKLSRLPKLDYYVEEVKYGLERQKEFISRGASNVNVYFIPNPKSPIEGGKFYNCYISRASNLKLEEVLPLDLDEIVPPDMDIDAIEWYVQEHADPTFKTAGGIILNKDESIGGVTVYKPNDGKVGITPEEKSKYEQLEELSKKLKEMNENRKKEKEEFLKLQEAYFKSQAAMDEQIATIQEAMDVLVDNNKEKGLK